MDDQEEEEEEDLHRQLQGKVKDQERKLLEQRQEVDAAREANYDLQNQVEDLQLEIEGLRAAAAEAARREEARQASQDEDAFNRDRGPHSSGSTGETRDGDPDEPALARKTIEKELAQVQKERDEAVRQRDDARRERDEALQDREDAAIRSEGTVSALQLQIQQLQRHLEEVFQVSDELQMELHEEQRASAELRAKLQELQDIEASREQAGGWNLCAGERKMDTKRPKRTLFAEMELAEAEDEEESDEEKENKKPGFRRAMSRGLSSTKLQQLAKEFQERHEKEKERLEEALRKKHAIEAEKEKEMGRLKEQISQLQERLPKEDSDLSSTFAGLTRMLARVKGLTLEASDAMVLGMAGDGVGEAGPTAQAAPLKVGAGNSYKTLPGSTGKARDRLKARRERKGGQAAED